MKPALFALVSLVLGVAIGWIGTRNEFTRDAATVAPVHPAGTGQAGPTSYLGPRAVVVNGERHDFGTMDRFASGSHTFQVRNDGNAPLELTLGHTTCKCTVGNLTNSRLPPGETTDVKLDWQVKTGDPQFEQSAQLITNDPHHNPIHLVIHGKVIDTIRPEDAQITLNEISTSEETVARLSVFAFRATDLQVTSHRWAHPEHVDRLQVSFEPLARSATRPSGVTSGVTVVLKVLPGLPLGQFAQTLVLTFNLPDRDPLELPVFGTVISDIGLAGPGVAPTRLLANLGTVKAGVGLKRTVFVVVKGPYRNETQVQLASAEPSSEFMATLGEPLRDNPALVRFPLTIEIPKSTPPVARTGDENFAHIKLAVAHPHVKEVIVNVRYVVAE